MSKRVIGRSIVVATALALAAAAVVDRDSVEPAIADSEGAMTIALRVEGMT